MAEKITKKVKPADYSKGIPELLEFIAKDDIQVELRKQTHILESQQNLGIEDPRVLNVTDKTQHCDFIHGDPFRPWTSMYVENAGPGQAYIGINQPARGIPLPPGGSRIVGHSQSLNKISIIYYWCDPGKTATINVVGQY